MIQIENKIYEPINLTYYNPRNSFFKAGKSDRERYTLYSCCNKDNCDAYKREKCLMLNGLYGRSCPYGKCLRKEGFTKSARKCGDLILDIRNKYGEVEYKLKSLEFLCRIGEYIYIPLPHLTNYVNSIRDKNFFVGESLIKSSDFTKEFVMELIKFRPLEMFGGEITDYQKKEVPKFIIQLKRYMPDMYIFVLQEDETIANKITDINYVGKKAYVKTLLPSEVKLSTNRLTWTGDVIKATGNQINFWRLSNEDVTIIPTDKTLVEILDNESVTEDTIFENE